MATDTPICAKVLRVELVGTKSVSKKVEFRHSSERQAASSAARESL